MGNVFCCHIIRENDGAKACNHRDFFTERGCCACDAAHVAVAESRMGVARTIITGLVGAPGGVIVGVGLCYGIGLAYQDVGFIARQQFTLSPVVLVVGALMAASAFSDMLTRRRIGLIGYVAILVVLLYGGNPGDYCMLAAALIGQIIGRMQAGAPRRKSFPVSQGAEAASGVHPRQLGSEAEIRRLFGRRGQHLADFRRRGLLPVHPDDVHRWRFRLTDPSRRRPCSPSCPAGFCPSASCTSPH